MEDDRKKILLIVDDESSVCRALTRMLNRRVDETASTTSAMEAEVILESKEVTHVICDHWFGSGQTLGTELAPIWKKKYPSIERIVILTGMDIDTLDTSPEIYSILTKAAEPETLIETLGLN